MKLLLVSLCLLFHSLSYGMSIDWKGAYRVELWDIDRPYLGAQTQQGVSKSYILHSLYLAPQIIAADGVQIRARFEILPSNVTAYSQSQAGQIWGLGTQSSDSSLNQSYSQTQGQTNIRTSEAYLQLDQEYGSLIVGRAPFEFGLGMTYNAGRGSFDHWMDNRDLLAYKILVGDWSFTPMLSRVYDSGFQRGEVLQEQTFILQYENKENGSMIGYVQDQRKGPQSINDAQTALGGSGVNGGFTLNRTNFILGKAWSNFAFKFEAGFQTGGTGIVHSNGENIEMNGYGLAAELLFPRPESKWNFNVRLGMATGDNPDSANYEGYQFDRNYDVAMLLFNHRLGANNRDFLRTSLIRSSNLDNGNSLDDEAISNAIYLSPQLTYAWNDKLDLRNTLTYAVLATNPNAASSGVRDFQKDLGFEWDIELIYKPHQKIQWVNQLGLLQPGKAFENGSEGLTAGFTYGFASKAVVSF